MKCALAASEALADYFSVFVNQYGHEGLLVSVFGNGCSKIRDFLIQLPKFRIQRSVIAKP
jgi:hypothetical protein